MKGKRPLVLLMLAVLTVSMLAAIPGGALAGDECTVDQDNDQNQGAAIIQDSFDTNLGTLGADSLDYSEGAIVQSQFAENDGEIDECDD